MNENPDGNAQPPSGGFSGRYMLGCMLVLYLITLLIRWIPLFLSPLSYNIDGFSMAGVSDGIISSGHWSLNSPLYGVAYNQKTPFFPMILSEFSLITGISPLYVEQYMLPFITASIPPFVFYFVSKLTQNLTASIAAALFLAFNGLFSFLTGSIMKESLGLLLIPVGLYLYMQREDIRKRILLSLLLIFITFVHYRSTLMLQIFLILLLSWDTIRLFDAGKLRLKGLLMDIIGIPFIGVVSLLYYLWVSMQDYYGRAFNINEMVLFLSVAFIWLLIYIRFMKKSYSSGGKSFLRYLVDWKAIALAIALGAFLLNSRKLVFAGTINTSPVLIAAAVPYIILIIISLLGLSIMQRYRNNYLPLVAAIYAGTFIPITYSLVRGLDAFSQEILYRSYNFMDFATAISLGIGLAFIYALLKGRFFTDGSKQSLRVGIPAVFALFAVVVILLAATVPLGYDTVELFGVQNVTYEYEVNAIDWTKSANCTHVGTDQRLGDIMRDYNNLSHSKSLPWELKYQKPVNSRFILLEGSWRTWGAQMHPSSPVKVEESTFSSLINRHSLIFSSGHPDAPEGHIYILMG